jgi:hypothetical protein
MDLRNAQVAHDTRSLDEAGPGALALISASGKDIAVCVFSVPAFGAPANGVAKANPIQPGVSPDGGRFARAEFRNGRGEVKLSCSVVQFGSKEDLRERFAVRLGVMVAEPGQTVAPESIEYIAAP